MKELACGDIVSGCQATFRGETDEDILQQAADHAREEHGITEPPPELVEEIIGNIRPAP